MHWQALQFVQTIRDFYPDYFYNKKVLEIGSHSVNGSVRQLFNSDFYTGVDLSPGIGVDVVTSGHEFRSDTGFDIVISCECFEHNPYYAETLENMINHLNVGGLLVFTCATTGRPEHGTARTTPGLSPGTSDVGWDYYKNLVEDDFKDCSSRLLECLFFTNEGSQDLYCIGTLCPELAKKIRSNKDSISRLVGIYETLSTDPKKFLNYTASDLMSVTLTPAFLFYLFNEQSETLVYNHYFRMLVDRAFLTWPNAPETNHILGRIKNTDGQFYEALRLERSAAQLATNKAYYLNSYSDLLASNGDIQLAIDTLKKIELYESKPNILWKISNLLYRANALDEGLSYIEKAVTKNNDNPIFLYTKMQLSLKLGLSSQAKEIANSLVKNNKTPSWIIDECELIGQRKNQITDG